MRVSGTPQQVFEAMSEWLESKGEKEVVAYFSTKETREIRTLYQNNFWYGIFSEIQKQTDFSAETIKQYLLARVFGKKEVFGELVNIKTKTSELTKKEAQEFLESLLVFIEEHSLSCKYTSRDYQSLLNTYL